MNASVFINTVAIASKHLKIFNTSIFTKPCYFQNTLKYFDEQMGPKLIGLSDSKCSTAGASYRRSDLLQMIGS